MSSASAACDTLCNPDKEVSAHYVIAEDGSVTALVPEDLRAWHAGTGRWGPVTDVNSRSIGIELANTGRTPFAAPLMDTLVDLLGGIMGRWDVRPERVIGHSDMAPGRKIDPGPRFDWRRLALHGLSVWPEPVCAEPADFTAAMRAFGYTATDDPELLLDTFRRRFRPWAQGPLDAIDAGLISDLAHRFPVDAGDTSA